MVDEVVILIAEDDDGHAELIKEHLEDTGLRNPIIRFRDGQETLDFLFQKNPAQARRNDTHYLLLLDIRMPKVDGESVLRQVKAHPELKNLPVIMLTTTDDPREVKKCYDLGCNCYITKPVEFRQFAETLKRLGLFILVIRMPAIP
jgi:CheY-like chemotaxis protein